MLRKTGLGHYLDVKCVDLIDALRYVVGEPLQVKGFRLDLKPIDIPPAL